MLAQREGSRLLCALPRRPGSEPVPQLPLNLAPWVFMTNRSLARPNGC